MGRDRALRRIQGQARVAEQLSRLRAEAYKITTESSTAARLRLDHLMADVIEVVGPLLDFRRCPECKGYGLIGEGTGPPDELPLCPNCGGRCAVPIPALSRSDNVERIADHIFAISKDWPVAYRDDERLTLLVHLGELHSDSLIFRILREGTARADGRARIEYEPDLGRKVALALGKRFEEANHDQGEAV